MARSSYFYDAKPAFQEMMRLLLEHRADVNSGDHINATPLHWAAMRSKSDSLVKMLLASRADLNVCDTNWQATPLEWAGHNTYATAEQKDLIIKALTSK
mmetsp:Transcript_52294/g.144861  ORF Transcript_52294/g.144861 Transcript_52294/m.144861 type:complete len:99 (+) Transcript_52294:914-1210(+)